MKLKIKNFNWLAGRPVVFLNKEAAKKLNVHVDERVSISADSKKVYAVVDIFEKILKRDEIGVSDEISRILNLKKNSRVEVSNSLFSSSGELIKRKLSGEKLTEKEFNALVSEISRNNLTESEIAYFVAAEKIKGMSGKEVIYLIKAMVSNGNKLSFLKKIIADKHCIGGIAGNRTTPIIVSICAAAGLTIPKNSSRAITSASGTADVMETLSNVEFAPAEIKKIVDKTNACLVWGGSLGLAPSDDKIIHVERILNLDVEPQLIASILAKKISAGSTHVLIDIPYGASAKVSTRKEAKKLGAKFRKIAGYFNLKLRAVYTNGSQPIGNGIGPLLEMRDVLAVLKNNPDAPRDLREKALYLASELMSLCGIRNSQQKAAEILESGKAYAKFREIVNVQNKKEKNSHDFEKRVKKMELAQFKKILLAEKTGKIVSINNNKINSLCRVLGTPENKSAGCYLHHHLGKIKKGAKLMTLYSESKSKLKDALKFIKETKPVVIK